MRLNGYPEKSITKWSKGTLLFNSKSKNGKNLETPKLFIPYEKGIAEQLKVLCYLQFLKNTKSVQITLLIVD